MQNSLIWLGSLVIAGGTIWGCGSSESGLEDGSGTGGAAGASGSAGASSGGNAGSASGGSAGSSCQGTHPEVDGGERRCPEGECRCKDTSTGGDQCLPEATAAACCGDGELECFREGGKVDCKGEHPQVEGDKRFCQEGMCLCESRDACLPAETAALCCPQAPKCN